MGRPFLPVVLLVTAFLMISFSPGFGKRMMLSLDHANSAAISFQEKLEVFIDYEPTGPNVHSQPALFSPPPPPAPAVTPSP